MQTRLHSLLEVLAGLAIGFTVSVIAGQILYPLYGMHPSIGANAALTGWFTILSLMRGYLVRRLFTRLGVKKPAACELCEWTYQQSRIACFTMPGSKSGREIRDNILGEINKRVGGSLR